MTYRRIALFLVLSFSLSCERDDICAESTPTTPRLLIEFYDITVPEDLKNVVRLTAYGEDLVLDEDGNPIQPTEASEATLFFNENTAELALPLLIGNEGEPTSTRFVLEQETNLRLDVNNPETSNEDRIEISYIPEFVYVSRACGYKSIFTNLDIDIDNDGDTWIRNIIIDQTSIENETSVHVRIFH